jgi:hypothetical protein
MEALGSFVVGAEQRFLRLLAVHTPIEVGDDEQWLVE